MNKQDPLYTYLLSFDKLSISEYNNFGHLTSTHYINLVNNIDVEVSYDPFYSTRDNLIDILVSTYNMEIVDYYLIKH